MTAVAATGGVELTTSPLKIAENPSNSGEVRAYEVAFLNVDGQASANLTVCRLVDASAGVARPIWPKDYPVKALDSAERLIVLDPGDRIEAAASAPGDIYAHVQQVYAEPVP